MNEIQLKIYNKIQDIKYTECEYKLSNVIDIRLKNNSEKELINNIALSLKPWRKGPFKIDDMFIDSEWKSYIKFDIIKNAVNLENKRIADIGCNNGYYLFRMLEYNPYELIGFDPSAQTFLQFLFINKFIKSTIKYKLHGIENIKKNDKFDVIFCLGVLYHRSDPISCLKSIKQLLKPNGVAIIDTMFISGDEEVALCPKHTYSKIKNIYFIPTIKALQNWCTRANFKNFEIIDTKSTNTDEQRKTDWIDGYSLQDFLNKEQTLTIEGYESPKRVYVKLSI